MIVVDAKIDEDTFPVPAATRFPVELRRPPGFVSRDPATWPRVEGRLEYVGGRLYYMPPCGKMQAKVVIDVGYVLRRWQEDHPAFAVLGNEAGMMFGRDIRAADTAVWRSQDVDSSPEYARVPPLLAVEVAGRDEDGSDLREKARWYLDMGVEVVWIVLPPEREILVVTAQGETRCRGEDTLPAHPSLPGLAPAVRAFFSQLDR